MSMPARTADGTMSASGEDAFEPTGVMRRPSIMIRVSAPEVELVDGKGRRVGGPIVDVLGPDTFTLEPVTISFEPEPRLRFCVVQALPKADRGELAVELMTEVGADEVIPWSAERCVTKWKADRSERAHRKWVDSATAATKQSRRSWLPVVHELASTAHVCDHIAQSSAAFVLDESAERSIVDEVLPEAGDVLLIVGPEGGVAPGELTAFVAGGARPVRLGPNVLRTSTAGAAAVAVLAASAGVWTVEPDGMGG